MSAARPAPGGVDRLTFSRLGRREMGAVMRIEEAVFPEPWSPAVFFSELALREARAYLAAKVGRRVVGYFGLMFVERDAHVTTLAVHPDHQGRGLGKALMLEIVDLAVERDCENLSLEVASGNRRAQALYRAFGLAPIGVRKRYYPATGEDALVMMARDIGSATYARRLSRIEAALRSAP